MKKSLFLALSFFCFFLGFAQSPQYVGHRGSYLGVENTYAAFVNGAQKYPYIECDIRVTADSAIVISHDLTTNRVGGNLEVAGSFVSSTSSILSPLTFTFMSASPAGLRVMSKRTEALSVSRIAGSVYT